VTFAYKNPTWITRGTNPGLRREKPATNNLAMARPFRLLIMRCEVGEIKGEVILMNKKKLVMVQEQFGISI
jgi:hypothetical protein